MKTASSKFRVKCIACSWGGKRAENPVYSFYPVYDACPKCHGTVLPIHSVANEETYDTYQANQATCCQDIAT
jgi:hypothetical protein